MTPEQFLIARYLAAVIERSRLGRVRAQARKGDHAEFVALLDRAINEINDAEAAA